LTGSLPTQWMTAAAVKPSTRSLGIFRAGFWSDALAPLVRQIIEMATNYFVCCVHEAR